MTRVLYCWLDFCLLNYFFAKQYGAKKMNDDFVPRCGRITGTCCLKIKRRLSYKCAPTLRYLSRVPTQKCFVEWTKLWHDSKRYPVPLCRWWSMCLVIVSLTRASSCLDNMLALWWICGTYVWVCGRYALDMLCGYVECVVIVDVGMWWWAYRPVHVTGWVWWWWWCSAPIVTPGPLPHPHHHNHIYSTWTIL